MSSLLGSAEVSGFDSAGFSGWTSFGGCSSSAAFTGGTTFSAALGILGAGASDFGSVTGGPLGVQSAGAVVGVGEGTGSGAVGGAGAGVTGVGVAGFSTVGAAGGAAAGAAGSSGFSSFTSA